MIYDLLDKILTPQIVVMFLAGLSGFAAVLSLALPALQGDRRNSRMKVMATERDKMRAVRLGDLNKDKGKLRQAPKGFMQQIVDQLNLRKTFDTDEVRDKLKMAGFRGEGPRYAFVFFRLIMPIIMFVSGLIYLFLFRTHELPPIARLAASMGLGYLGFYLPSVFVSNLIQKRQESIKNAFPDALDLLLICVQSGMSVEAAFAKVGKECGVQSLELAEEFAMTTAELSYLQERRMAYENLGARTGLPGVKAVMTALIQAERYGTPVGTALRVMAKENRDQRMSDAEKKAGALPPKLTVPMILFFLPVLFAVIIGPAIIQIMRIRRNG